MLRYILVLFCLLCGGIGAQQPPKENDLDPSIDLTDFNKELDLFSIARSVISSHVGGLEYIYRKYKGEDKNFVGEIMIKIVVNQEGIVTDSKVMKSELKNKNFQTDVIKAIKGWKFGKLPGKTQDIITPFYFK